jgi:hypothetical protein
MTCPDSQLLSVYHDDELPSPWKEKMESHLASCESCRQHLEGYQKLSTVLADDVKAERIAEAQARVWSKFQAGFAAGSVAGAGASAGVPPSFKFASRRGATVSRGSMPRLSLPVPVAAAAAVVVVVSLGLAFASRSGFSASASSPVSSGKLTASRLGLPVTDQMQAATISKDTLSFPNMTDVLQYMSAGSSGSMAVIQLPQDQTFNSLGNPSLIRAADYHGDSAAP